MSSQIKYDGVMRFISDRDAEIALLRKDLDYYKSQPEIAKEVAQRFVHPKMQGPVIEWLRAKGSTAI